MDHPLDFDTYVIDLEAAQIVDVVVDSMSIDPVLIIDFPGSRIAEQVSDDDSGGGIFDNNAKLTYQAPYSGSYQIVVSDAFQSSIGGYFLTVSMAPEGAIPVALPPPLEKVESPLGTMAVYESERYPFSIQYFDGWVEVVSGSPEVTLLLSGESGETFMILEQDLAAFGLSDISHDEYLDLLISQISGFGAVKLRESVITSQGLDTEILLTETLAGLSKCISYLLDENIFFMAAYQAPNEQFERVLQLADYSFGTFRVEELPVAPPASVPTPTPTPVPTPMGAKYGGVLKTTSATPGTWDVNQSPSSAVLRPLGPRMQGLMKTNPYDGGQTILPGLATSWEVSDDGLRTTFPLRDGAKFHDGSTMTADDVVASWTRIYAPRGGNISYRRDWFNRLDFVYAVDQSTVQFVFREPSANILTFIASDWNAIFPKKVLEENNYDLQTAVMHPGAGPFRMAEYKAGELISYEKFEDFWDEGFPYLDGIKFHLLGSVGFAAFLVGQIDTRQVNNTTDFQLALDRGIVGEKAMVPIPHSPFPIPHSPFPIPHSPCHILQSQCPALRRCPGPPGHGSGHRP